MSDQNLAPFIASTIAGLGVKHAFVYPGDPIIDLLEALRVEGIDVVLARREGTAAIMAEATGVRTGLPGVCVSTLGPGSTAMVGGVASANSDRVPMLAISGQIERSRESYFTHQVIDHDLLFSPITKWTGRIEPASAATIMRKSIRTAMAERPGVVHLTMHGDLAAQVVTDSVSPLPPLQMSHAGEKGFTVIGGNERDVVAKLNKAKRPLILAGASTIRNGAVAALAGFAESISAPVVAAPMAKGVISEDHELFAGVLEMACTKVIWDLIRDSDLLLLVGFDAVELILPWQVRIPAIHIDVVPNTDQIFTAEHELIGDMVSTLSWLAGLAHEPRWTSKEIAEHRSKLRAAYEFGRVSGTLNPTDIVDVAREVAGDDAVCTTDVGSHKILVGQGWRATKPLSVLMSNGLSAMGFAIPAAIGAALAGAEKVYCLVGDGGFAMTQSELALAAERKLPIVVLVFCDHSLNRIELKQQLRSVASTATRLGDVDIVQIAQGLGCDAERAEDEATLEKYLSRGAVDRPLVLELPIDPAQYVSQF